MCEAKTRGHPRRAPDGKLTPSHDPRRDDQETHHRDFGRRRRRRTGIEHVREQEKGQGLPFHRSAAPSLALSSTLDATLTPFPTLDATSPSQAVTMSKETVPSPSPPPIKLASPTLAPVPASTSTSAASPAKTKPATDKVPIGAKSTKKKPKEGDPKPEPSAFFAPRKHAAKVDAAKGKGKAKDAEKGLKEDGQHSDDDEGGQQDEEEDEDESSDDDEDGAAVELFVPFSLPVTSHSNADAFLFDQSSSKIFTSKAVPRPSTSVKWDAGESVPYAALTATFDAISQTTKRLEISALLTNFLVEVIEKQPEDLLKTVYLCINRVSPPLPRLASGHGALTLTFSIQLCPDYEPLELGIGESLLMKAIGESTGRTLAKVKEAYKKDGDLGKVAQARVFRRVFFRYTVS